MEKSSKKKYPKGFTAEQRKRFDAAMKEIQPDIDRIRNECIRSETLTAADFAVTINAR